MSSFWDKFAPVYDISDMFNSSVNEQICKAVYRELSADDIVLDCAAGTGLISMMAAMRAKHVVCTDYSREMLIQAMKKARKIGLHNISFARRDIYSLKDPDGRYDVVIAGNVIHLLDDPSGAFSELVRVTKKGGKILIPTYLQGESGLLGKAAVNAYKLLGFSPRKGFTIDEYLNFISENAEANGCSEYSTELLFGRLPAGFAVIKK